MWIVFKIYKSSRSKFVFDTFWSTLNVFQNISMFVKTLTFKNKVPLQNACCIAKCFVVEPCEVRTHKHNRNMQKYMKFAIFLGLFWGNVGRFLGGPKCSNNSTITFAIKIYIFLKLKSVEELLSFMYEIEACRIL